MAIGEGVVEGGSMIVVAMVMGYKGEKRERERRRRQRERERERESDE